jgi:O-antigen/teichoic acid export membrane protein
LKELYLFGFNSTLFMASDRIQRQTLPIIIGHVMGAQYVVFFAMPKRLIEYAKGFIISIGMPLTPYFSTIDAKRKIGEPLREWFPSSRALTFVSLPVAITLFALGERFIHIWLGVEYATQGRWVIILLSVSFFFSGILPNSRRVLVAAGQHGPVARRTLIASIVTGVIAVLLTRIWGVSGTACALMVGEIIFLYISWVYVSKYIGITLAHHLKVVFKPLIVPLIVLVAFYVAGLTVFTALTYGNLIQIGFLAFLPYLISAWFFALKSEERQMVYLRLSEVRQALFNKTSRASEKTIKNGKG